MKFNEQMFLKYSEDLNFHKPTIKEAQLFSDRAKELILAFCYEKKIIDEESGAEMIRLDDLKEYLGS